MISDRPLYVDCDQCGRSEQFSFRDVLEDPDWQTHEQFDGWRIDWDSMDGEVLCPACLSGTEATEEVKHEGA